MWASFVGRTPGLLIHNTLVFAEALRAEVPSCGCQIWVGDVDTYIPMGSMTVTVMDVRAKVELEIKRERITDSVAVRRTAGKDLGGRRQTFTISQIRNALRLIEGGRPATQVARDLGMSRAILYRRVRELPVSPVWFLVER